MNSMDSLGILIMPSPGTTFVRFLKTFFMKKMILIITISFSLCILQSCDNDKKEDKEISAGAVPASVQSAFSAKYSTASDVKWEDAHEDTIKTYKAKFVMNGKKMKAEFDANGSFVKEEEDN